MKEFNLTLVEHLAEFRKRLIIVAVVVLIGGLISYGWIDIILNFIMTPAGQLELVYLSPPEILATHIKIAFSTSLLITSPVTIYHIWSFVKPALKKEERKLLMVVGAMSVIFFLIGFSFAYFIILPMSIDFFVRLAVEGIQPMFSYSNYISFAFSLLFSFGVVFELPLLVMLLSQLGVVTPISLKRYRKIIILVIFIVSAVLTPPDVASQVLMAIPMILLYELSIIISTILYRRKRRKALN